ncbi:hypothetical protein EVAR_7005_1 [Eumeta japonica]|uniref:Uncharacterized protein n=1 Tax=Eumeta variegata TaxID=151549 RepID=A0A4C1TJQ5_EUMVA|nr:hypothetical protein EVAR_7005_1 [Eumeta japonica]
MSGVCFSHTISEDRVPHEAQAPWFKLKTRRTMTLAESRTRYLMNAVATLNAIGKQTIYIDHDRSGRGAAGGGRGINKKKWGKSIVYAQNWATNHPVSSDTSGRLGELGPFGRGKCLR